MVRCGGHSGVQVAAPVSMDMTVVKARKEAVDDQLRAAVLGI